MRYYLGMQVYLVGGAVRDERLGIPVTERDWCVVGSTAEELLELGYKRVGKGFPVFLHPNTGEEYALARTERKSGPGHTGFEISASPSVTIEEDLERRDLTINAMAIAPDGALVDPYGGAKDLAAKRAAARVARVPRRPAAGAAHRAIRGALRASGLPSRGRNA